MADPDTVITQARVVTITVAVGTLKWGYAIAATVRNAIVTRNEQGVWAVSGLISGVDRFRVTQQPLTFEVQRQGGPPWRWPVTELQVLDGSRMSASLGPKESESPHAPLSVH